MLLLVGSVTRSKAVSGGAGGCARVGAAPALLADHADVARRAVVVAEDPGVVDLRPARLDDQLHRKVARVPPPVNIYVNLGFLARRFSTVTDRFSGSWCRFPESWGKDGENGEKMGKKRGKNEQKWARNGLKRVGAS